MQESNSNKRARLDRHLALKQKDHDTNHSAEFYATMAAQGSIAPSSATSSNGAPTNRISAQTNGVGSSSTSSSIGRDGMDTNSSLSGA